MKLQVVHFEVVSADDRERLYGPDRPIVPFAALRWQPSLFASRSRRLLGMVRTIEGVRSAHYGEQPNVLAVTVWEPSNWGLRSEQKVHSQVVRNIGWLFDWDEPLVEQHDRQLQPIASSSRSW